MAGYRTFNNTINHRDYLVCTMKWKDVCLEGLKKTKKNPVMLVSGLAETQTRYLLNTRQICHHSVKLLG